MLKQTLKDMFRVPTIGQGLFKVWLRNFFYFRYTWIVTAFWTIFEPVLYLLSIGIGLGQFVGQIQGVSYVEWFFSGLLASTAMMVAFFENTYGSFTKLGPQKTFSAMLTTPISAEEIAFGEIIWGMTKGMFGVLGVALVGALFGYVGWKIFFALFILGLLSFVFSAIGLLVTSYVSHYDSFIYMQSGFIMPMYLFSGTYFPIEQLPKALQIVAWLTPLCHGVHATRALLLDQWHPIYFLSCFYLLALGILISNWASARIHRKLIY